MALTESSVDVPDWPSDIVGAYGSAWVLTENDDNPTLQRIDPNTSKVTGTVRLPLGEPGGFTLYHMGLAVADGSLWVSDFYYDQVMRIDPWRLRVISRIDVGRAPISLIGVGETVWVANYYGASVSRIDTRLDRVVQTVTGVGDPTDFYSGPRGLAYVEGVVWANVPGQQRLYGIDARSGRIIASDDASPAYACSVIFAAPDAVILDDSRCSNTYARFDVKTGVMTQVTAPDSSCLFGVGVSPGMPGIAAGDVVTEEANYTGGDTCDVTGSLVDRDPVTGAELNRLPVTEIGLELFQAGHTLWADDSQGDDVLGFTTTVGSGS